MRIIERAQSPYQSVVVRGDGVQTEFQVQGAVHAWRHEHRFLSMAWGAMAASVLLAARPPRSVLMLGLAGGTVFRILRHLLPDARLVAVEIDPWIHALARKHMRLDDLAIEVHLADAKHWLAANRRRFDAVIDDCYLAGAGDVYRPHALDAPVQQDLLRAVAPGGLLAVNLITGAGHRRLQSAYRAWFRSHCRETVMLSAPDSQNEILAGGDTVAGKRALRPYAARFAHHLDARKWKEIRLRRGD